MKRKISIFQPKVIIASKKLNGSKTKSSFGGGGSCIGGNCKAVPKIADIFE